jgi:hypothetical protein
MAHRHRAGGGYVPMLADALRGVVGRRQPTGNDLLRGLGVDVGGRPGRLLHMRLARPRQQLWMRMHKAYEPRRDRDLLPYVLRRVAEHIAGQG